MQDKKQQRDLMQRTVDTKSLGLLRLLVGELKLNCSGCFLHGIVAEAPLDLLTTLMRLAGSLNARHPELKSTLIHKVQSHASSCHHLTHASIPHSSPPPPLLLPLAPLNVGVSQRETSATSLESHLAV